MTAMTPFGESSPHAQKLVSALSAAEITRLLSELLPEVDHRGELVEEIGERHIRVRLPVHRSYLSQDMPRGSGQAVLSGPIMLGFAETAMFACVHAFYGAHVFAVVVTFNASFLGIAGGDDLVAEARLLKQGRRLAFVEAHLYTGSSNEPCAHVTATYALRALEP